jgi:Flp pilus assembly pilin Flp
MRNLFIRTITAVMHDRKGISALEYAILAAAILGAIGTAFTTIGGDLSTLLGTVKTNLTNIMTGT